MTTYVVGSATFIATLFVSTQIYAQNNSLNGTHYAEDIGFVPAFNSKILPLDTNLPWLERFNGNEEFNEAHSLSSTSMATNPPTNMAESETKENLMFTDGFNATGVVKAIKTNQEKIKIAHGPIDKFGMPAMTMMFKVTDPLMLEDISNGDHVMFNVDESSGGFVISALASANKEKTDTHKRKTDAVGTVKTVRVDQEKIKIEHGPIEKFGMPAMTMMFKVVNPTLLEGLTPGTQIEFNVDSSSGGFVITHIQR